MLSQFDQHHALHEDWIPNSSDPLIFSSDMIDDISSKYAPEIPLDNNFDKDQNHSLSTEENFTSEVFERENGSEDLDLPKARGRILERLKDGSLTLSDISVLKGSLSQYIKTPAISPMSFLDSPTFLSNTLVQPSPTTGNLPFSSNKNCTLGADDSASFFDDFGSSTFESKPIEDSDSSFFPGDTSIVPMDFSVGSSENTILETMNNDTILGGASNSLPLDEQQQQQEDEEQRSGGDVMMSASLGEDGYNWRKYGQKQVKCSDYPRSYYKCTHPNCPVKKKVERSYEGLITEIIYEKSHNHPEPVPNRRLTFGSSNHPTDVQLDLHNQNRGGDAENSNSQGQINGVDHGLTNNLSNIKEEEDHNHQGGGGLLGYDGEEDEQESKRRKIEASYPTDQMSGATRAIRMPRVVVQAKSEIDILEDGYRWRKYGQKVVKGNPNPRSYYKCTSANCPVRKHVERASHDLASVVTTYEGKHNHPVPAARNSSSNNNSHVNSANQSVGRSAASSVQSHQHHPLHRVDPYQVQNEMPRFNRPYGMTGRQLIGHPNRFNSFGMNQGLGTNMVGMGGMNMGMGMSMDMGGMGMGGMNMGMGGMSPMGRLGSTNQGNMPVLPAMPNYLGQQNQMGLMMPKGEPISDSSMNNIIMINNHNNHNNNNIIANGSCTSSSTSSSPSVYHQIMNNRQSPVGPQI